MGKKSDALAEQFSNAYAELDRRLTSLERLAQRVQGVGLRDAAAPAASTADRTGGTVDYGAVAFGLSEIKRKIGPHFGNSAKVLSEYQGAVDYFADVFAKADPNFDRVGFNERAGR